MERKVSLIFGFIVGIIFIILPINKEIFEGLSSLISVLFYFTGLLSAVVFGGALILDAFRNLNK